jgi:hypothetical protein
MPIIFSPHALEMLAERNIERQWAERTVTAPDFVEADPAHADRRRAFRSVPECEGRILRVVYVQSGLDMRVITAFLDRGRSRAR